MAIYDYELNSALTRHISNQRRQKWCNPGGFVKQHILQVAITGSVINPVLRGKWSPNLNWSPADSRRRARHLKIKKLTDISFSLPLLKCILINAVGSTLGSKKWGDFCVIFSGINLLFDLHPQIASFCVHFVGLAFIILGALLYMTEKGVTYIYWRIWTRRGDISTPCNAPVFDQRICKFFFALLAVLLVFTRQNHWFPSSGFRCTWCM